jgi:hypothetical protein
VWLGAFACFFVLGATWAFASPLLSVPDEPAHLVKSAAVARGQLTGDKMPIADEGPGSIFRGGFTVVVDVPRSYTWQTSRIPNCFIYDQTATAGCAPAFRDVPGNDKWTTWVGEYPPTYYAAVGVVTLLDTGRWGFSLARLWSAALSAAFLASAFACACTSARHRVLALGVVLAATPMTLFLAGSINPNGLEIATAVCFWSAFGALLTTRDARATGPLAWAAFVSGVVLVWTRPMSVLWLALATSVLVLAFGGAREALARVGRGRAIGAAVALGVLALGSVVWALALDALGNAEGDDPRGLGLLRAIRHSAGRTDDFLRQMVGVFGWRTTYPPVLLAGAWLLAVAALVGAGLWAGRNRARFGLVAAAALTLVVPVALESFRAHDHGFAWQGRYGLPLAVGVPITAALALATGRSLRPPQVRILTIAVVGVAAFGQVLAHVASMRRYVMGSTGSWWYLTGDGWNPPLPAPLLLVAVVGGAVGLAVLTTRVVTGAPVPPARSEAVAARPEPAAASG